MGTSSGTELNFFPRQEKLSKKQAKKERAEEEKVGMEKQIAEALKMFQAQMQLQQAQLSAAASTAAAAPGPGSKSTQLAVLGSIPGGAPATGAFAPAANTAATNPPPNFAGAMVAQVRERERERERGCSLNRFDEGRVGRVETYRRHSRAGLQWYYGPRRDHGGCSDVHFYGVRESKASREISATCSKASIFSRAQGSIHLKMTDKRTVKPPMWRRTCDVSGLSPGRGRFASTNST